mgnify:CR=1 FL=1
MNILVFAPYASPHTGGVENYIDEFNLYATSHGHRVTVFAPKIPIESPVKETKGGADILRYPAFEIVRNYPLPKLWLPEFWKSYLRIRKKKFDVIISHTRFFFSSLLALFFAKRHRISWMHIEHGSSHVVLSSAIVSFLSKLYDLTIGRLIFRLSDKNIAISNDVRRFIERFDSRPTPVIHRGIDFADIDTAKENFSDASSRSQRSHEFQIVSVGRLTKLKGFREAILAVSQIPESQRKHLRYTIIGDGEEREALASLARKCPEIHMTGKLPRNLVLQELIHADIFLHSSLPGGGLATTLLEAMACGCAVVASPHEGALDAIENGKNGLLATIFPPTFFYKAITQLLTHPQDISRLSKAAERSVRSRFSWEQNGTLLFHEIEHIRNS